MKAGGPVLLLLPPHFLSTMEMLHPPRVPLVLIQDIGSQKDTCGSAWNLRAGQIASNIFLVWVSSLRRCSERNGRRRSNASAADRRT